MTRPPRLIVRTMAVTFVTVAVILSIVFIVLTVDARERVRSAEIEQLRASGRVFAGLEARRHGAAQGRRGVGVGQIDLDHQAKSPSGWDGRTRSTKAFSA